MKIQINTDKTVLGDKRQASYFNDYIANAMKRYEKHLSRIEVHLKDENGPKPGVNKISCLLEARIEGKQPLVVSHQNDTVDLALSGALDKLNAALETVIGKLQNQ